MGAVYRGEIRLSQEVQLGSRSNLRQEKHYVCFIEVWYSHQFLRSRCSSLRQLHCSQCSFFKKNAIALVLRGLSLIPHLAKPAQGLLETCPDGTAVATKEKKQNHSFCFIEVGSWFIPPRSGPRGGFNKRHKSFFKFSFQYHIQAVWSDPNQIFAKPTKGDTKTAPKFPIGQPEEFIREYSFRSVMQYVVCRRNDVGRLAEVWSVQGWRVQ